MDQGARLGTTNRDNAVRVGEEFWRIDDVEEEQKDSVSHEQDQKNDEDQVESVDGESRTEVVIDNDMLNRKEEEQQDVGENNQPNENEAGYTHIDIKKNDIIRYKLPDSEWETVKILSRAGKATGKNKFWWNVEVLETGNSKSVKYRKSGSIRKSSEPCGKRRRNRRGVSSVDSKTSTRSTRMYRGKGERIGKLG